MVTPFAWQQGHPTSALCSQATQTPRQAEAVAACQEASTRHFTINGNELKSVETFKYLGHIVSSTDSDWPALQKNLTKARRSRGMIS